FKEALTPEFKIYQQQIINNAKTLANELTKLGYRIVSGGTDNHLLLVDVKQKLGITGLKAEEILESVSITCNKNAIPFDQEKPRFTSGIRLGTPAVTTRGMKEAEMIKIANLIDCALTNYENQTLLNQVKKEVLKLTKKFKLYR
ncbi:MAG: serine hydroxymethyltransferase, partial [Acholeplasmataceae bacterium]|nr:serine hydroxymethyltransferase [Acholeplasmataceae bacterium]